MSLVGEAMQALGSGGCMITIEGAAVVDCTLAENRITVAGAIDQVVGEYPGRTFAFDGFGPPLIMEMLFGMMRQPWIRPPSTGLTMSPADRSPPGAVPSPIPSRCWLTRSPSDWDLGTTS